MKLYKDHIFIGNLILILTFFIAPFIILGCCTPEKAAKPVVHMRMFPNSELTVKGFDTDCDGDIDYWQHYNSFANKVGRPIWTKQN